MQMLKIKFRCLVLVLTLVLVSVSCNVFAAKKPIKLVFGSIQAADNFLCKGDRYFKELVEKNSKGRILIDYFPAGQLGSQPEMNQAVRTGAQQLGLAAGGNLSQYWSKLATLDLPYIFRDEDHILKVLKRINSIIVPNEMASKTGMRILNIRVRAPRHLTTKFPVNKLEDIKGLKIRVPENSVSKVLWKNLGTIPIVISGSEVYQAIATGTVDAQENPYDSIYGWKYYELVKYCAHTGHVRELVMMVINNKCWKSLTAKERKIIRDAAAKSGAMGLRDVKKEEKRLYDLLVKEGMKFTNPDIAPFREKAKKIWDQFGDAELLKKIEAIK
jgi:tripartite ATP-independent transporter DctP family solute receptor